jgi:hypothetical protein
MFEFKVGDGEWSHQREAVLWMLAELARGELPSQSTTVRIGFGQLEVFDHVSVGGRGNCSCSADPEDVFDGESRWEEVISAGEVSFEGCLVGVTPLDCACPALVICCTASSIGRVVGSHIRIPITTAMKWRRWPEGDV